MASSDAAALAPLVGQIVFIVEAHSTQQAEIEAGLSMLSPARASACSSTRAIPWRASISARMATIIIPPVAKAMNGVRPTLHRARPAARFWRLGSGLAFWGLLVAIAVAAPAAAQAPEGGAQSPPSAEGGTGPALSPAGPAEPVRACRGWLRPTYCRPRRPAASPFPIRRHRLIR